MAKTDVKLNATDPLGKATTASITYVNPEATNTQLRQLGQMLNAFTNNVYESTYRINTIHCDSEAGKQTPTLEFRKADGSAWTGDQIPANQFVQNQVAVYYDGDADTIFFTTYSGGDYAANVKCSAFIGAVDSTTHLAPASFYAVVQGGQSAYRITVTTAETANYNAATFTQQFVFTSS